MSNNGSYLFGMDMASRTTHEDHAKKTMEEKVARRKLRDLETGAHVRRVTRVLLVARSLRLQQASLGERLGERLVHFDEASSPA